MQSEPRSWGVVESESMKPDKYALDVVVGSFLLFLCSSACEGCDDKGFAPGRLVEYTSENHHYYALTVGPLRFLGFPGTT